MPVPKPATNLVFGDLNPLSPSQYATKEHGKLRTHGVTSLNSANDLSNRFDAYNETGPYYAEVLKVYENIPPPSGSVAGKLRTTLNLFGDQNYPKLIKARILERYHTILDEPNLGPNPTFENAPLSNNQNNGATQAAVAVPGVITTTPNTNIWDVIPTQNATIYKPRNKSSGPILYIYPGTNAAGREDRRSGLSGMAAINSRIIDELSNFGCIVVLGSQSTNFNNARTTTLTTLNQKGYTITDKYIFGFSGGGSGVSVNLSSESWKKIYYVDALAPSTTPSNFSNIEIIYNSNNWTRSRTENYIDKIIAFANTASTKGALVKEISNVSHYELVSRAFASIVNSINNPTIINADTATVTPASLPQAQSSNTVSSASVSPTTSSAGSSFAGSTTQKASRSATEASAEKSSSLFSVNTLVNIVTKPEQFKAAVISTVIDVVNSNPQDITTALSTASDSFENKISSIQNPVDPKTTDTNTANTNSATPSNIISDGSTQPYGPVSEFDKALIDRHDTFVAFTDRAQQSNIVVGSIVVVDYMDRKNKIEPIFIDVCVGAENWVQKIGAGVASLRGAVGSVAQNLLGTSPAPLNCGKKADGNSGTLELKECAEIPREYVAPNKPRRYVHPDFLFNIIEFMDYYNNESNPDIQAINYKILRRKTEPNWKLGVSSARRTTQEQINLRIQYCNGNVTDKSYPCKDSQNKPIAVGLPGNSNHQAGEAVDFNMEKRCSESFQTASDIKTCQEHYEYMKIKAKEYGLINLPSENWHYSVNGG
jgi:hypothetical protein